AECLEFGVPGNVPLRHANLPPFALSALLARPLVPARGCKHEAGCPPVIGGHQHLTTAPVEARRGSGPRTCSVTVCDVRPWPLPSTATVTYTACCPAVTDWVSGWGGCWPGWQNHWWQCARSRPRRIWFASAARSKHRSHETARDGGAGTARPR